jgi:hypothetical protein
MDPLDPLLGLMADSNLGIPGIRETCLEISEMHGTREMQETLVIPHGHLMLNVPAPNLPFEVHMTTLTRHHDLASILQRQVLHMRDTQPTRSPLRIGLDQDRLLRMRLPQRKLARHHTNRPRDIDSLHFLTSHLRALLIVDVWERKPTRPHWLRHMVVARVPRCSSPAGHG